MGDRTEAPARVLLAEGELSWPRGERVADRYGAVSIQTEGVQLTHANFAQHMADTPANEARAAREDRYADFRGVPVGRRGQLVAEVVEARESYHIGDLFHGFVPSTPEVGEEILLGEGELFVETASRPGEGNIVGLRPRAGELRVGTCGMFAGKKLPEEIFWLNPEALYRAHSQRVRLYFEEEGERS